MDQNEWDLRSQLVFLKLGGSLITDKTRPGVARLDILARVFTELASTLSEAPNLKLVLGHGSGSFGHVPANRYGTRQGVHTHFQWKGFGEVWHEAAALNRLVMEKMYACGLRGIAFPPSASIKTRDRELISWNLDPLLSSLRVGLLPVIYGDVIFDRHLGGTIYSTEELFINLARQLSPSRILLAGLEPGVWLDFPARNQLIPEINHRNHQEVLPAIKDADGTDVTGGMSSKVKQMLDLVQEIPGLEVRIFSGIKPGDVKKALINNNVGTVIKWNQASPFPQ